MLGNFVQRHAEAIANIHNVTVLYVALEKNNVRFPDIEDTTNLGVRSIIIYDQQKFPSLLKKWQTFQKGVKYLESSNPQPFDLIHHNVIWNNGWQAVFLSRKYNIPVVVTEHWTGYDLKNRNDQPTMLKPFSKWIANKASMICPVSQDLSKKMQNFGLLGNYTVVPNVVDTELFRIDDKPKDTIQFLHVSSLNDAQKNITGILRVWKKITDQQEGIKLVIGGDGPYQHYKSIAENLYISAKTIEFFGEKKPIEISQLMNKSHCLILFSNYENLPVVIVEAMASGLFILSTRVGGIAEHVDDTKGLLINAGDELELEKTIITAMEKLKTFNGEESRNYAINHFSKIRISQQYDAVYHTVLNKKN